MLFIVSPIFLHSTTSAVKLGVDQFFAEKHYVALENKKIGLIINHTSLNSALIPTDHLFKSHGSKLNVVALFSPEHGFNGSMRAFEKVPDDLSHPIPIYSLHGETRRPTEAMLKGIDVLIFDIQDVGSRNYTYASTLFYAMEEAAKRSIAVIVLDRPNPVNGLIIDGPLLDDKYRSFIGYINVPVCHGMTIGELALFFNNEYHVGCNLKVVKMQGWNRNMTFKDTKLPWVPTSPNIPEPTTPIYYLTTGILGELSIVNMGVGYTLPFKIIGAPFIDALKFAEHLNNQRLPGVKFLPYHFRPYFGKYKDVDCHGVMINVQDEYAYRPITTQLMIIGSLKSLYPKRSQSDFKRIEGE